MRIGDEENETALKEMAGAASRGIGHPRWGEQVDLRLDLRDSRAEIEELRDRLCSTCEGLGEIDERLGGISTSGMVPCPDCSTQALRAENEKLKAEVEEAEKKIKSLQRRLSGVRHGGITNA